LKELLNYPHKAEWTPFQTHCFSENLVLLTNTWSIFFEKVTVTHFVNKYPIFYAIEIRVWEVDVEISRSVLPETQRLEEEKNSLEMTGLHQNTTAWK
jgi:hypothetical protein